MATYVGSTLRRMQRWDDVERATLVALLQERPDDLSWPAIAAEIIQTGSARAAWEALHTPTLLDSGGDLPEPILEAARQVDGWRKAGLRFHTFRDDDYPAQLREIHQLPPILFSRGTVVPDETAVSVVGSRRASAAGLTAARDVAEALVAEGITVVSGLADGIDTAAHVAALNMGGRTVGVLGTGINRVYPPANRDLQEQIADRGLLLSQFWPDAPPTRASFPMRNATMSGYGRATVVVEAGETSGARIQARVAVEHGRPVILTDSLVKTTRWARELTHRPGVHVACGADGVLGIVRELVASLDDPTAELLAAQP